MNKKTRDYLLIGAGLVAILIFINLPQKSDKDKSTESDFATSFKESNDNSSFNEYLDSVKLIYSNYRYGIAMDLPDNWTIDKGVAEHTLIRASQKDSGITFVINVIELKDMTSDVTLWQIYDDKSFGFEEAYKDMLAKSVNVDIYNLSSRKVNVTNREAIEWKFNFMLKNVDIEYEVQGIYYSIYVLPYSFTVAISVPTMFYKNNPDRYNYLIHNLSFTRIKNTSPK